VIAGARMLHWTVRARLEHPELPRSDGCEHEYREPRGDGRPERPKGKAASIRPLGPPNPSVIATAAGMSITAIAARSRGRSQFRERR